MKRQTILAGCLMILAALTFWISWFLMPDPGTTDANHILAIVKQSRVSVLSSVIIQIISSVLYVVASFLLVTISSPERKTMAGTVLLGIGAMGFCSDAFFHLLAFFMTDASVSIQENIVRVMNFMQTKGLIFLVPILLPLFSGSLITAIGLNKQKLISNRSRFIFISAFLIGFVTVIGSKINLYRGAIPILAVIGIFAAGQAMIGIDLLYTSKKK